MNFIGLSERDRFELSGADLEDWLRNPAEGKEILMRNLNSEGDSEDDMIVESDGPLELGASATKTSKGGDARTLELPLEPAEQADTPSSADAAGSDLLKGVHLPHPRVTRTSLEAVGINPVDTLVLGLGFEERAMVSASRILAAARPTRVIAISYEEPGNADQILSDINASGVPIEIVLYETIRDGNGPELHGHSLIDITGLAKPAIFKFVRSALRVSGMVSVVYTQAEQYYPLDFDLTRILEAEATANHHQLLLALKDVLMGEKGPYKLVPLLPVESDGTRMRGLCAFASSKHERLLHLVETRDYDQTDIMVDDAQMPCTRIAEIAAEVAGRENQNASISKCPYQDAAALLEALGLRYEMWFVRDGLNFEIGLTGNKIQAVAAAAFSASAHVNQVWYVSPAEFDKLRFTKGVGTTHTLTIEMNAGEQN